MNINPLNRTASNTGRFKKAIAAGVIGLTALGATSVVPAVASAQEAPTEEAREARQAERAERRAEKVAVLTDALGVGEDVLQAAREAGQSIADVATAQGVSVESVVSAIVENKTAHIQEHVAAGDLTQDEANEKIAGLAERVTERVNSAPGERGDGEGRGNGRRGPGGADGAEAAPAGA